MLVDGGTTVLLTTQYLEEADVLADNIIVIDHGKVIAEGTATELKYQLGATDIEVGFKDPVDARAALGALGVLGSASVDNGLVRVSVSDGATAMLEAVRLLDAASLKPATLALHEPTLDDVFLSLTGHAAEEESPDGEESASKRRGR